ncbi:MAG: hypothetical protein L6R38_009732, partial [Xanthoria sp. 2 TBL-2021]
VPLQQHRVTKFNLLYGYFALMGGFVTDVKNLHNSFSRLTISPKGIATLAKHGRFSKIPDSTIRDKSKADTLAKGLALIQVAGYWSRRYPGGSWDSQSHYQKSTPSLGSEAAEELGWKKFTKDNVMNDNRTLGAVLLTNSLLSQRWKPAVGTLIGWDR